MHDPSGTEIARGWGGLIGRTIRLGGGGGMDIFWNHTSNKGMQSLLTATLSLGRGQVWKGVAPAHNIVGRPTLETNNLGAPVSQCILSDQGEILAKKKKGTFIHLHLLFLKIKYNHYTFPLNYFME